MRSTEQATESSRACFASSTRVGAAWLLLGYTTLAVLGLRWSTVSGAASPVWPAAGAAVAGLWFCGMRLWPLVVAGTALALLINGSPHPAWAQLLLALGNGLGAVGAVWIARRLDLDAAMERARDVLVLGAVALVGAALTASFGALTLWFSVPLPVPAAGLVWTNWFLGDLVGILTAGPLLLLSRQ